MLVLLAAVLVVQASSQMCRTISLEGGGSHGAYEAGALWALANLSHPEDVAYNVVTGISAGALNAFGVCQFAMGDEIAMSEYLVNLWLNLNGSSSVFQDWEGGLVDGLLFQKGIYNTAPLIETLRKDFIHGIQRNITVGSTNLDTGMFATFNESVGNSILNAVVCSASPPFFFPPQQFEGYTWSDGGCIINLDVFSSIERCLDVTPNEANIIVDLVFDGQTGTLPVETKFKTLDVLGRTFAIRSYDSSIWYTYNAMIAYPKVNFRYIIHASEPMPGGIVPLNFTKSVLEREIQMGINDTTALLKNPVDGRSIIQELFNTVKSNIIYP